MEGVVKRQVITPGHLLNAGGNRGKRVRLTRKTRPGATSHVIPDPGQSNAEEMEKSASPSSEGVGGEWACLAIFFLDLGLGEFCTGDAWNLHSEATGRSGTNAPTVLLLDHWILVTINAYVRVVGFWTILKGTRFRSCSS